MTTVDEVKAGIEAHFRLQSGITHNLQFWCHYVPVGLASVKEAGSFLKRHLWSLAREGCGLS